MFELKLGSGFDNMINLVALAKVSSFHVRSKKCDQNVTRPPGGSCRTSRAPMNRANWSSLNALVPYQAAAASRWATTAGDLRSELPRSRQEPQTSFRAAVKPYQDAH